MRALLRSLPLLLLLLAPLGARADLFSPGDLANDHADLEGLKNCTKCHEAGEKLSENRCLDCHDVVNALVKRKRGLHGRLQEGARDCQKCHSDHKGRAFDMGGLDASPKSFEHDRSGYALVGKHKKVECRSCHDARLINAPEVKAFLAKKSGRRTYLGAPSECKACHFDEHREQIGQDCKKCHDLAGFKPAPGFDHQKTEYVLRGAHKSKVKCEQCHVTLSDDATAANAFPAPKSHTFVKYVDIPHAACTDCHEDPHDGRFGRRCEQCHVEESWQILKAGAKDPGFHDKTRYPLKGEHRSVECRACHGPWPGKAAIFKNMKFQACLDCHPDGHVGQLAVSPKVPTPDCKECHTEEHFAAPTYELPQHEKSRFPLDGLHRAVSCRDCHALDEKLGQVPAAIVLQLKRRFQKPLVSAAKLDLPAMDKGCRGCHEDPHGGQLDERVKRDGCEGCHRTAGWSELKFDHDKESRYPLDGAHEKLACGKCHASKKVKGKEVVTYRPLPIGCDGCHEDEHVRQFVGEDGTTDCRRCHDHEKLKEAPKFRHAPPFTDYLLDGAHEKVACKECHKQIQVATGVKTTRYVGTPRACEQCHGDVHDGGFRGFEP